MSGRDETLESTATDQAGGWRQKGAMFGGVESAWAKEGEKDQESKRKPLPLKAPGRDALPPGLVKQGSPKLGPPGGKQGTQPRLVLAGEHHLQHPPNPGCLADG